MPNKTKHTLRPALAIEKEVKRDEISTGLNVGVEKLEGKTTVRQPIDNTHNTKYLLKQYRRVAYAVEISESELNLRMEMEHGTRLSTLEVNAELAGVDLSNTKLEAYAQSVIRSKSMLEIIKTALDSVRKDPDRGELMYQILYETYFTPSKPRRREDIIDKLDSMGFPMSIASYHNYLNAAIHAIDRILWGYTARDCIEIIKQFLPD